MPYEIPQQLEYKEKIIFGLTFGQLAYVAIAMPFVLWLFFRTPFNVYVRSTLALIPTLLALSFMFLNLDKHMVNWYKWLRFRKASNKEKLERFVGLSKIADDTIYIKDKKVAILKVIPINFSIKKDDEKEAITKSFQKFLNALDFPIQILMDTDKLDLNRYLERLSERVRQTSEAQGMDYSKLFNTYKDYLISIVSKCEVKNRNFYIIIPETSNLDIQIEVCTEMLKSLSLKAKKLATEELKAIVSKYFNGSIKLYPESILNNPDNIMVGRTMNRIIYAHGYPRVVESGFLDRIVRTTGDFNLSLHINPYPIETMMVMLNRELQKQRADLYAASLKSIISPSLEIKYEDTRKVLETLQKGKDKLFNVSLYIACKSKSQKDLELLVKKIEAELNALMIQPKVSYFRMAQGFKSVAPFGRNELNETRNITTEALSAFFPFTSPFLQVDDNGVWIGLNNNGIPIIKDIFSLSNPNGLILSQSGGGKSYFCKLLISRYLLNGTKVMVIDPQGEYVRLVEHFRGQRIDLSRTSKTIINPLDLIGHDYAEKRLSLMDLMQVMLGELTEPQKAFIDRALTEAYTHKGITDDPSTWNYEPPILADVFEALKQMERKCILLEKSTIRSLMNRLSMYVDGVFSFMNNHTTINFNNRLVCFDIGNLPKQVKPTMMFLVLDYVYMKMKSDLDRKILLIDEAWSLLSRAEDATYIFEIVKTCRKFNLGLLLINQEVEGMLDSEAGKSVLANSAYTLLMRQKPAVIRDVCETFNLSDSEKDFLLTANVGEGILIMEDEHSEIKVVASEEEHKLITTKADELSESSGQGTTKKEMPKNAGIAKPKTAAELTLPAKQKVSINVDEHKGFYRHKDLNLYEIKYLLSKKYQMVERFSIASGKVERFLLKPRFNEGVNHLFAVYDIAEYLEKTGIIAKKYESKLPDLTFELNGGRFAIEVETGTVYDKARKQLRAKVSELNRNYDCWFFVVTNRNYAQKYRTFGKTVEMRYLKGSLNKLLKVGSGNLPTQKPAAVGK
ncbi:MAG: DUF87 domain-containing protein [Candidatus Woesearchaeota archaeon]